MLCGRVHRRRSAVVDVRCDPEEKVFPMVPAGAAAVDVMEAPDEQSECRLTSSTGARLAGRERKGRCVTLPIRAGEQAGGAGARLAALFAARVQHPEPRRRADRASDISRLTLRVDCSEHSLEQIEKQMHKLVNVLRVTELRPDEAVERELALFTVSVSTEKRAELLGLSQVAGARVAAVGANELLERLDLVGAADDLERDRVAADVRDARAGHLAQRDEVGALLGRRR